MEMTEIDVEEAAARNINPLLLASARKGFWEALDFLFKFEDAHGSKDFLEGTQTIIPIKEFRAVLDIAYRRIGVSAPPDDELGVEEQPAALFGAEALLQGVTSDGDTALHAVASNGDDQDFLKSAGKICRRNRALLFAKNHNGDTPLHCARRAGNPQMVSYLIDLTGPGAAPRDINPLLLFSARAGSCNALDFLFRQAVHPPTMVTREQFHRLRREDANRTIPVPPAGDVEQGVTPDPYTAPPARDGGEGVTADRDTETPTHGGGEGATPDRDIVTPGRGGAEGVDQSAALLTAARELLKGVAPNGDTALHAVASNGDGPDFLKYADIICGRDRDLLFAKNHNGDTPLHCAARAGNSKMVSRLIHLAGAPQDQRPNEKFTLLRMENNCRETALHEAIRFEDGRILGSKDIKALFANDRPEAEKIMVFVEKQGTPIVKELMLADSRLADYPVGGISPFYLAILLGKSTIALTLYNKSHGNLSYSGADGKNALHVAVLRNTDTGNTTGLLNASISDRCTYPAHLLFIKDYGLL
jgi:ankyrin repeat protein